MIICGNTLILSLLLHFIRHAGSTSGTNDPRDPAHEIALIFLVETLRDNSFGQALAMIIL